MRELSWAAGFFDGEGTTSAARHKRGCWKLVVKIEHVRREPLDRFAAAVGINRVTGPSTTPGRSQIHRWQAGGAPAHAVATALLPHLSAPKREQIAAALARLADGIAARENPERCSPGLAEIRGLEEIHYRINGGT